MYKVFFIFILISFLGKAQNLCTIPDQNFLNFLKENYPNCIQNNQLDATNELILYEDELFLDSLYIEDFTGLECFKNLKTLDISYNLGRKLPELSKKLIKLNVSNNLLESLPITSKHLIYLDCSGNRLIQLNDLPEKLEYLNIAFNQFSVVPKFSKNVSTFICNDNRLTDLVLNSNINVLNCANNSISNISGNLGDLSVLDCSHNSLVNLPMQLNNLKFLNCSFNQIKEITSLSNHLMELDCSSNFIEKLPILPNSLMKLNCSENKLKGLPVLPNQLIELLCAFNEIKALPLLPSSLKNLWISFNKVEQISALPKLVYFYANDNKLTCLPGLPNTIEFGDISNNQLSCIPNKATWMNDEVLNLAICSNGNETLRINCLDQPGQLSIADDLSELHSTILIYPNPTNQIVFVESENNIDLVKIIDIEGKVLYSYTPNASKIELDLMELINGIYFIQVTIDSLTSINKIIKE